MQKRLYKIEEGKKIDGVCGGIAEYLNIDPTIVRLLWVLVSLAYGLGVILYIAAMFIMPTKSEVVKDETKKAKVKEKKSKEDK